MDGKELKWAGSSLKDITAFPDSARREAGYQLRRVQFGMDPDDWKPFKTIGPGVREIRIKEAGGTYRVVPIGWYMSRNMKKPSMCCMPSKRRPGKPLERILI